MRLILIDQGVRYDIEARFEKPGSRVSDLREALERRAGLTGHAPGMFVDGLFRPGDTGIEEAGLHEGAVLTLTSSARADLGDEAWPEEGSLALLVLTGPDAGRVVPLPTDGEYRIGRGPECHIRLMDPTLSRLHCGVQVSTVGTVTVVNFSTSAGTRVAGVTISSPEPVAFGTPILLGATTVVVDRVSQDDRVARFDRAGRLGPSGTISFNRPPRVAPEPIDSTLDPPVEPQDAGKPPFNVVSMVAPAAMGLVMVFAFHNALYAMFALLSPIMVGGNWWESRHRSSKALRASTRSYARDLVAFEGTVSEAWHQEVEHRRAATPSLAEVARRARLPSVHLWERRPFHDDFLRVSIGFSDVEWKPKLAGERRRALSSDAAEILARHRILFDVPVVADVDDGGVIGIAGPRESALSLARGLACQAAALHGPADLRMGFLAAAAPAEEWEWAKWLPHTRDQSRGSERRLVAAGVQDTTALLASLIAESPPDTTARAGGDVKEGPTTFFVVDGPELLSGRAAPTRRLLSGDFGKAAGVVIAPTADLLPAVCSEIVELTEGGEGRVVRPRLGRGAEHIRPAGMTTDDSERIALQLARFDDPELRIAGAGLPPVIRLGALLGVEEWVPDILAARWNRADATGASLSAAIGAEEEGPFTLDLDRHGPHGLIGGTTGSGKSELLKTIVASLAAGYPPDQLTFGLFDFKGGSTFTELAFLPHTVGTASDLDVNLARRALRCLRAELLRRELVFDQAGVADLTDLYERRRRGDATALQAEALPRLVVIIDEFAAMAKELSEEIGSIADLTARGRSLGVHLLLATQKPSSAVNAEVRTNTRLRISLKVEDRQDSVDVVGIPDAAGIDHKGRGYFRVGQGEVLPIQSALSTGPAGEGRTPAAVVTPFGFEPFPTTETTGADPGGVTELQQLVEAARRAFVEGGLPPPRRPWPDPLPDSIGIEELAAIPLASFHQEDDLYFALADDPERQTRYPVGWPMRSGNLLLFGVVGSGTTTTLATIALAFARGGDAASRHLYILAGSADLAPLERLPHCAGVVRPADRDRQIRVLRRLIDELDRRRREDSDWRAELPTVLIVVDNLDGFRAAFEDSRDTAFWDQFVRIYSEGPEVGIYTVGAVTRIGGLPAVLSTATPNKVVFRLADAVDYGAIGLNRTHLPTFVPGRAIMANTGLAIQIARPLPSLDELVGRTAGAAAGHGGPERLGTLSESIPLHEVAGVSAVGGERWDLGIARRDRDLRPATLTLYEGEHALVAGRARSGRSTALLTIASSFLAARAGSIVLGVATRRSPLVGHKLVQRCATSTDEIAEVCNAALMASLATVLLVDDAEMIEDSEGTIASLLGAALPNVRLVAAANADALRSMYGHWTATVRRSRAGLLLQPSLERDGDLLGASLPYRVHVAMPPGRGFLVCGSQVELVQVAI